MDALTNGQIYKKIATPIARDRRATTQIGSDVDYERVTRGGRNLLIVVAALVGLVVLLSLFVRVEEVARARGEFVPTQRLQVIQTAEGGSLQEILVRNDDRVTKGEIIARFRATDLLRDIQLNEVRAARLEIEIARLEALATGEDLNLDKYRANYATMVNEALELHKQQNAAYPARSRAKGSCGGRGQGLACGRGAADSVGPGQHAGNAGIAGSHARRRASRRNPSKTVSRRLRSRRHSPNALISRW